MIRPIKRVAAINDLSGFGRASLTSIIPILSTMGVQVCPLPTAILSTHTGDFNNYSFIDLTDSMEDYINHWNSIKIEFDCIYSGFLGSPKQISIISKFIDLFKNNDNIVVIDPVMGDNGKLYATMNEKMIENMRLLIKKANIITPNFTEAAYLLNRPCDLNISINELKNWMIELSSMGPEIVIITSAPDKDYNKITNVVAYDRRSNRFWKVSCSYIPAYYPGTGDAFTSVIIGSILQGDSLPIAIDRGVQFITAAIKASYGFEYPKREGVLLERVLQNLNMPVISSSFELF